jgi:PAS domain S-box-containing protein
VHPEDLSNVDDAVYADDGMDERIYKPVRLRRNDGIYRWFEIRARDSRDEAGRLLFRWQRSSTGELFYLNSKVSAYTGKTLEQLREPGWRDSVHPEDVDSFVAEWTRAMQGRSRIVVEFRLRRFDGAFRWFRTTGEPILDSQSDVLIWCGVPGGHLKIPHPWPGQNPPPGSGGTGDDYAG